MKQIGILLLMISITSCRSPERSMVCSEINKHEIPPYEKCAIDMKNGWCRCFIFDANRWKQLSEPVNHDLIYCDGIQGARIDDEATIIRPRVKALWRLKENLCESKP